MSKSKTARTRRLRRTTKKVLKYGSKAKRKHAHKGGRSGSIHSKSTKS